MSTATVRPKSLAATRAVALEAWSRPVGSAWVIERPRSAVRVPFPTAGSLDAGQVLLAMESVGLCGTDLHAWRGRAALPLVPCHDGAALVVAVGSEVERVQPGQRVVVDPSIGCGVCSACGSPWPGRCDQGVYLGMSAPGLLAEGSIVPERSLVLLRDGVDARSASVLEPVAVALALLERVGEMVSPGGRALVVGGGPLGLVVSRVLAHAGFPATVSEALPGRRDRLSALGAEVADPRDAALSGPFSLAVETSATEEGSRAALQALAPGGVLAVVGRSAAAVRLDEVLARDLAVVAVRGGAGRYQAAVDLVTQGAVAVHDVVSHEVAFAEAGTGLALAASEPDAVFRVMVRVP